MDVIEIVWNGFSPNEDFLNSTMLKEHLMFMIRHPSISWNDVVFFFHKNSNTCICRTEKEWNEILNDIDAFQNGDTSIKFNLKNAYSSIKFDLDTKLNGDFDKTEQVIDIGYIENIDVEKAKSKILEQNILKKYMTDHKEYLKLMYLRYNLEEGGDWIYCFSKEFVQKYVSASTLKYHHDFLVGCINYCIEKSIEDYSEIAVPRFEYRKDIISPNCIYILLSELLRILPYFYILVINDNCKMNRELEQAKSRTMMRSKDFYQRVLDSRK